MTGRDPFARPDGVVGGVDPRHRGEEFGGDDADLDAYVSREDLAFSPRGNTHQGLQLPPNVDGRGSSSRTGGGGGLFNEPRDDAGDAYSPWANPRTRMVNGGTARRPKRPKRF